jgi:tripartite-type tricarboxylate transporter receptor subunit TctC
MTPKIFSLIRAAALAVAIVAAGPMVAGSAYAQSPTKSFPAGRPITILVGYAAGGTTDAGARWLAAGLEEELSTKVNVVNKPGAASQTALQTLLTSAADGYTLSAAVLPTVITHYADPAREAPYARKDFLPVALHHLTPATISVQAKSPYKTLKDFVEAARAAPGKITISDSGLMANPHMCVLMLERAAKVRFGSVHFDGGAPSVTALLGGHVTALSGGTSDAAAHYKAGTFRVLGVADERESEFLPGAPTMKSQGYDVIAVSATGIFAPAGTPKEVVDLLTAAIKKIVATEDHKKKLRDLGAQPNYLNPTEYAAFWSNYESRVVPLLKEIRATQAK